MKFFAVFVFAAIFAFAFADEAAAPTEYVGDIQDAGSSDVVRVGEYSDCEQVSGDQSASAPQYGIPSCKLGAKFGNPICAAKCIYRGNNGGYCAGSKCTCV